MTARAGSFWLAAIASACAVPGFSITDQLPGGAVAGMAGATSAGTGGGGAGNGGSMAGAKAQGGVPPNTGGSADAGGDGAVTGGEPPLGGGGAGEGGAAPMPPRLEPCATDVNGLPPLLCDDFESGYAAAKWNAPAGTMPEPGDGPFGTTRLAVLDSLVLAAMLGDFALVGAGAVTISFWFRATSPQQEMMILRLQARAGPNAVIQLRLKGTGLQWQSALMMMAPNEAIAFPIDASDWNCTSIHFNDVGMELKIRSASDPDTIKTLVVDDVPTPTIDETWLNQPVEQRTVAGFPRFGTEPLFPGRLELDDVRISNGPSNVCGF